MFSKKHYKRHFEPQDYKAIHALMKLIGEGDDSAREPFLKAIMPVMEMHAKRIGTQVFENSSVDTGAVHEFTRASLQELLADAIKNPSLFEDRPDAWTHFSVYMQTNLRSKLIWEMEREEKRIDAHTLLSADKASKEANPPEEAYEKYQLVEHVRSAIATLKPKWKEFLEERLKDKTLAEVGRHYGVSRVFVQQIEQRAAEKLRHPDKPNTLRDFVDFGHVFKQPSADVATEKTPPAPDLNKTRVDVAREKIRASFVKYNWGHSSDQDIAYVSQLDKKIIHALMSADLATDKDACTMLQDSRYLLTKAFHSAARGWLNEPSDSTNLRLKQVVETIVDVASNLHPVFPKQR